MPEVLVRPPVLWPGLALAGAGAGALVAGGVLLGINGTCATPGDITVCERVYQTDHGGYTAVALGAAVFTAGALWFVYSAIDHPFFRRLPTDRRPALLPAAERDGGGLMLSGRY